MLSVRRSVRLAAPPLVVCRRPKPDHFYVSDASVTPDAINFSPSSIQTQMGEDWGEAIDICDRFWWYMCFSYTYKNGLL